MQQECTPFSQGWPGCLNNKPESTVHAKLAEAALAAGATTAQQQQALKDELIAHTDTDQTTKQYIGSWPTLGE